MSIIDKLAVKMAVSPRYPSLGAAFEGGEFRLVSHHWQGDVVGEAEAVAASHEDKIPCEACAGEVRAHPTVGWAIIVVGSSRIKGVRLCSPCAELLLAEETSREDAAHPASPYVEVLKRVWPEGRDGPYRDWGVGRPDDKWA